MLKTVSCVTVLYQKIRFTVEFTTVCVSVWGICMFIVSITITVSCVVSFTMWLTGM